MSLGTCEHVSQASANRSPLKRFLITGFYDGPTEGVAECDLCGQAYAFRMLAWDEQQDVRVFALTPLAESLDEIRLGVLQLARGDGRFVLVPPLPSEQEAVLTHLTSGPASCVVAALDLSRGLLAVRSLDPGPVLERDWFAWLGI